MPESLQFTCPTCEQDLIIEVPEPYYLGHKGKLDYERTREKHINRLEQLISRKQAQIEVHRFDYDAIRNALKYTGILWGKKHIETALETMDFQMNEYESQLSKYKDEKEHLIVYGRIPDGSVTVLGDE